MRKPLKRGLAAAMLAAMAIIVWLAAQPANRAPIERALSLRPTSSPVDDALEIVDRATATGADDADLAAMRVAARRLLSSGECATIDAAARPRYVVRRDGAVKTYAAAGVFMLGCAQEQRYFVTNGGQPISCGDTLRSCPAGSWRPEPTT
ncbi:MAG: hypothetical protein GC189_08375 [Alphaproteobacteria bacterium]|nr:hypothetical protein [Alphaproteobacteria bacterium]